MRYKKLWAALILVVSASFAVLGYFGWEIYQQAPPVPKEVVTQSGEVLFTLEDIQDGKNVWQSFGGQQVGSIWGHGAYQAPDWTADWLHREATWLLTYWANEDFGSTFEELSEEQQAALKARLRKELRTNTYDASTETTTVSDIRGQAIAAVAEHYDALFGDDESLVDLREAYAIPANTVPEKERREKLNAFYFWATWACVTNRPDNTVTYTQNWPPEELVGNVPSPPLLVWSVLSIVGLLAGIGGLSWFTAVQKHHEEQTDDAPESDPLLALEPTPSMKATLKYFWVVAALIVVQVGLGAATAHYTVEGNGFYGIPLAEWLPYSVTRTWHTQLGIFWIATAWLATGLFVAPAVSGYEPKWQKLGVDFLFTCLVIIVGGSLFGTWLGTRQVLGVDANHWFGHQGLEYVDLGRFWQIFLFIGLVLWLVLMLRALWPAFKNAKEYRHLLALFAIASAAIPLFYAAGLMWGTHTNLAVIEYWRWWVVHLWVEGFFEVFATVVIAFLFTRMGLLKVHSATAAVLFATTIFLSGGIIGTFHHLYFTGTPVSILALGAIFSALEVVPLTLIGFEAYENLSLSRARHWVEGYRWPIYFFVSVSFWNLVGAGLFGFLINPPIALYYMQGLNTTPVHAHTALFGVYGMLGIGLMLFCFRGLTLRQQWKTKVVAFSFWSINIGLSLMVLLSLLPVGIWQTWASVEYGMWYARSAEFLQTDTMESLRWMRVVGDTIFALGILAMGWFVVGLKTGWSLTTDADPITRSVALDEARNV